ncbi:dihydroneopterin aldolase, partial [Actinomyces bowdenii]
MSTTLNATTDRIRLVGLSARGHHGVLPFEREEGQLFTVDVTLDLGARGTAVAAVTDSLDDAVDYSSVANAVVTVIEGEPVSLLEALADRIAERVLAYPRVLAAEITVHKPQAPLDVAFEDVAMTIYRTSESAGQSSGAHAAEPAEAEHAPAEPRRFTSHRAEPAEPETAAALGVGALPLQSAPPPADEA